MADGQQALVKAPIQAGGNVAAILANSFDDAWRIGGVMAASGLTPFKRQEEACAAIMAGGEVGLPPFASLQSFMYVNGRLAMWGDAQLALVRAHGHKVEEWYEGALESGDLTGFTKVTRKDTGEIILESFSIEDAKRAELWQTNATVRRKSKDGGWYDAKNDSPWFRYPKRMLKYRARGFALRDGCSDILRGIKMVEEVQDYAQVEDAAMQARVVGSVDAEDCDQRPAEERDPRIGKFGVIGGQAGKDVFDDLAQRMSETEDGAALEEVWAEAEKTPISQNRLGALAEYYEAVKLAHEEGLPIPDAPRFTDAPEPSPFEALKAEGEKVSDAASFEAFKAKLTPETLGKCTDQERATLRTAYADAQTRSKQSGAGGNAGPGEGADHDKEDAPGGAGSSAPSSPFEALKAQGEAIRKVSGKRRQGVALRDWREAIEAAKYEIDETQAADLKVLDAELAKEIGA